VKPSVFRAVLFIALAAPPVLAQQHPNLERGFSSDKVYQFGGIDSVNVFNGAVILTIPIGQTYSAGALSYGWTLTYNSKMWDYEQDETPEGDQVIRAVGNRRSNAGLGWYLSLGQLIDPNDLTNASRRFVYYGSDGAPHYFYASLHYTEAPNGGECYDSSCTLAYTRDGSYLRMREDSGFRSIDFPDGRTQIFQWNGNRWLPFETRDVFGNYVRVTFPDSSTIPSCSGLDFVEQHTDSEQRSHYVCYADRTYNGASALMVARVVLEAFGGQQSIWDFEYTDQTVTRGCGHEAAAGSASMSMPMLTRVVTPVPDGAEDYRFSYYLDNAYRDVSETCQQGGIERLQLPTKGAIEWAWQVYDLPAASTDDCTPTFANRSAGVYTKKLTDGRLTDPDDPAANDLGTWRYEASQFGTFATELCSRPTGPPLPRLVPKVEHKVVVTTPAKDKDVHYFSIWPRMTRLSEEGYAFDPRDYGLPFTRRFSELVAPPTSASARLNPAVESSGYRPPFSAYYPLFLSKQSFDCDANGANCQLLRSTYVRYERDVDGPISPFHPQFDSNRRSAADRTVFHDDENSWISTTRSDFDGLGNYRSSSTISNFGMLGGRYSAADAKTVIQMYNPGSSFSIDPFTGQQRGNVVYPLVSAPWLLSKFTDKWTWSETSSDAEREQFCFEAATGFLQRKRTLVSYEPAANDLVAMFTRNAKGNVVREEYFGGDHQASIPTGNDLCSVALPSHAEGTYRVDHTHPTWSGPTGTNRRSQYWDPTGIASLVTLDADVDRSTGLASAMRDSSGIAKTFSYDAAGRLSLIVPPLGHDARTKYTYDSAFWSGNQFVPAKVLVERIPNSGSGTRLAASEYLFDPLGRVSRERRLMPDGTWSFRQTDYDTSGRKAAVSEWQTDNGSQPLFRTVFSYDSFGRPLTMTPPEGAHHATTFFYRGARQAERTVQVRTGGDASTILESPSTTISTYDGLGRLRSISEPSGTSDAWSTPSAVPTLTEYSYDAGDRLTKVVVGGLQTRTFVYDRRGLLTMETHPEAEPIVYSDFDARGHAWKKWQGAASGIFNLSSVFDRAERLRSISETRYTRSDESVCGGPEPGCSQRLLKRWTYATDNLPAGCTSGPNCDYRRGKLTQAFRDSIRALVVEDLAYAGRGGRVSMKSIGFVNWRYELSQTYTELGDVATLTYPRCVVNCTTHVSNTPRTVVNQYSNGFLTSVQGYGTLAYDPNGMVRTVNHANGVVDLITYDNGRARPLSIAAGSVFSSGVYRYDGAGNIAAIGSEYFLYDRVSRLVKGTSLSGAQSQSQTFDIFGNMTSMVTEAGGTTTVSTPVDRSNHLVGGFYDEAGNLVQYQNRWWWPDAFNMPWRIYASGYKHQLYTADGERIAVSNLELGTETRTLRDLSGRVLTELTSDASGMLTPSDVIWRDGQLLAQVEANGTVRHFHLDHLGTPRAITGSGGALISQRSYFGFGREATSTAQADGVSLKFTAHQRDQFTGGNTTDYLDYMHARSYDPNLGRFLSVDPVLDIDKAVREPQRWNRYSYVVNNPMRYVDPDGKDAVAAFFLGEAYRNVSTWDVIFSRDTISDINTGRQAWAEDHRAATHGFSPVPTTRAEVALSAAFIGPLRGPTNALIGTTFGKIGRMIEPVAGEIKGITGYAAGRMSQRGVTNELMNAIVSKPLAVFEQAGGKRLFLSGQGVVVLDSRGIVVTTYSKQYFDKFMKDVVRIASEAVR
jgi:RHS repeat-associated protein